MIEIGDGIEVLLVTQVFILKGNRSGKRFNLIGKTRNAARLMKQFDEHQSYHNNQNEVAG